MPQGVGIWCGAAPRAPWGTALAVALSVPCGSDTRAAVGYLSLAGQIRAPPSAICPVRGRYAAGIFCGGESARQARAYARRRPEAGDEHIDRAAGPCPTHGRTGRPTKASFQRAPLVAQIPDDEGDQTHEALENEALVERFREDFSEKA